MHALGVIVCAQLTTALGSYPHGGHAARVKQPSPNCLRRGLGCPVHGDSCNVTSHSSSSISHRSALVAPPPLQDRRCRQQLCHSCYCTIAEDLELCILKYKVSIIQRGLGQPIRLLARWK